MSHEEIDPNKLSRALSSALRILRSDDNIVVSIRQKTEEEKAMNQQPKGVQLKVPAEIKAYNYQIVYYTPSELTVDMEIDPMKVIGLKDSIRAHGSIYEVVSAWIDKESRVHIINGMHRTYCAQQLEKDMPGILVPVAIIDCDERTFRELRIIASSPHLAIKPQRIDQWIFEAWESSGIGDDRDSSLLLSAYQAFLTDGNFGDEQVQSWFERSSRMWGVDITKLARTILERYRTPNGNKITNDSLRKISEEMNLPIEKHTHLVDAFPAGVGRKGTTSDKKQVVEYARNVLLPLPSGEKPITPTEHLSAKIAQSTEKKAESPRPQSRPAPRVESPDLQIEQWARLVNRVTGDLTKYKKIAGIDFARLFEKRPYLRRRVADFMLAISDIQQSAYGEMDTAAEVARLRSENEVLAQRAWQFEQIVREQIRNVPVSPKAMVMSSTDIEMLG